MNNTALNEISLQLKTAHCGNLWTAVLKQQLADLIFFIPKKKIKQKESHEIDTCIDWDALKNNTFVKTKYCRTRLLYCRQALNWFKSPYYPFVCNLAGIDKSVIDKHLNKIADYVASDLQNKQIAISNKIKDGLELEQNQKRISEKVRKALLKK